MSVFRTLIINKFGADIYLPSPVENFQLNISKGGTIEHVTDDPYNVFSRYSEITFMPGIETLKPMESSNVSTRTLEMTKLKLRVRKNWNEPKRTFPTTWFINEGNCPLEVISVDCFDWSKKVYLMKHLPVLASVPIYSIFASYKKYVIKEPVFQAKVGVGYLPGAGHMVPNYVLEDKRKGEDLERVKRLLAKWKETQKNQVKVIM